MTRFFVLVLCGGLLFPANAVAQTPTPDVLGELLKEVRALRIAMERAATVGARIQLLVARVQMQEQRIAELSRRAVVVREELSKLDAGIAQFSSMVKRMDGGGTTVSAEERADFEANTEHFRAQLAASEKRRNELLNEESMLSQQISADQGRWTDVNNQLDQLERSLAPVKQ